MSYGLRKSAAATEGLAHPRCNRKAAEKHPGLTEELSQDPEEFRGRPKDRGRAAPGEPAVTGVLAFFTSTL